MPLQQTSGAASYDAFGGGVAAVPKYIEEYFSTFLYQGNDTTQAIVNGIDLSTKGGMVWAKSRTSATDNIVWDTARGVQSRLTTNNNAAALAGSTEFLSSFNTTGFTVTSTGSGGDPVNDALRNYVSWSIAKAPKFFDVVTYTGNGTSQAIAHNLGSVPGCIIVKRIDSISNWTVYHTATGTYRLRLNTTEAKDESGFWSTAPTSTHFTVSNSDINNDVGTYVAYLFAHNAGGFGLTGTDNVISCGSFTTDGGGVATVSLGYEPQWVMVKTTSGSDNWQIYDTMRGLVTDTATANRALYPNTSGSEASLPGIGIKATGFSTELTFNTTYIYIAIRRGPMKVPTSGTSVFAPVTYTGTGASLTTTTGINQDVLLIKSRTQTYSALFTDRLRGVGGYWINTASSAGENGANTTAVTALSNTSFTQGGGSICGASGSTYVGYGFTRAPSFFDEVCYTGTGSAQNITHNLGVAPAIVIVKSRSLSASDWRVNLYNVLGSNQGAILNSTGAAFTDTTAWNSTAPTSTTFRVGTPNDVNASGATYVAYLFATCAGVSKVGSLTVTAGQQININCGFTGGARFVMVKRTDAAGDWMVFDTARGINVGDDPYLSLNSTAAETTGYDWISPYTTGFQFRENLYAASSTYIYLAIA